MKTSELSGGLLNYWVAKALGKWSAGYEFRISLDGQQVLICPAISKDDNSEEFEPSTLWAQGGPIIERERIETGASTSNSDWWARPKGFERTHVYYGETLLIAAMRAFVAGKYGDEVPDLEGTCIG